MASGFALFVGGDDSACTALFSKIFNFKQVSFVKHVVYESDTTYVLN